MYSVCVHAPPMVGSVHCSAAWLDQRGLDSWQKHYLERKTCYFHSVFGSTFISCLYTFLAHMELFKDYGGTKQNRVTNAQQNGGTDTTVTLHHPWNLLTGQRGLDV